MPSPGLGLLGEDNLMHAAAALCLHCQGIVRAAVLGWWFAGAWGHAGSLAEGGGVE